MCGSWEQKRWVPAGAGGDEQLTISVLRPSNLVHFSEPTAPRAGSESPTSPIFSRSPRLFPTPNFYLDPAK